MRGICCIIPKVEGLTENIKVVSIVGRFLEHSRIYSFGQGERKIYISSGDMMTRNTENRVEISCPITSEENKEKIEHILDVIMRDNIKARRLQNDKKYIRLLPKENEENINSQEVFMKETLENK